ncbi:MAG: TonB-dependent receptor domain-containing protein, partial [Bryobacteraceae bacterium]
GQGLASMLHGIPSGGTINNNASRAEQSAYSSLFFHDDWRVTAKLTINAGVRWEYEAPITERFNRTIRDFDFATASPVSARALANYARSPIPQVPVSGFHTAGGLVFAGAGGQPRELWSGDKNNVAPRVGVAYQLHRRTVLRAGYGFFYDVVGVDRFGVNQGGFNQPTTLVPSLDNGQTFVATLSNPFPNGVEVPAGAAGGLATFLGRDVSFFHGRPLNPYMQRWSFSIQRELPPRLVMDAAYVGNRGTKLRANREMNPVPREYLSTSAVRDQPAIDLLGQQVNNPFFGLPEFAGTARGNQRINVGQLLRPYPHFGNITVDLPAGYSYFHSLQVAVEKRLGGGLSFQTSWTYSKFMEAAAYLNDTDSHLEKVVSDQDFPHRFVFSGIYELPLGRGKKWLSGAGAWTQGAAGGWQLQGWFEGQSGPALGFDNAIFTGDLKHIPLPLAERSAERWFN